MSHVDDILDMPWRYRDVPNCVWWFLFVHRLPAGDKYKVIQCKGNPPLYADYQGQRVRVTMASRLGDLGIARDHTKDMYEQRVPFDELSNFGEAP